ncbi:hypothetical protein [Sagittula stellata]|uniref:hypothetical protein n=1 Tax=Sagittula stellata TaxID=52603 RepID=UPI0012F486B6|nr:hypothetical protein [Sagittula stellata]
MKRTVFLLSYCSLALGHSVLADENRPVDHMYSQCVQNGGTYSGGTCSYDNGYSGDGTSSGGSGLGTLIVVGIAALLLCGAMECFDDKEEAK